MIDEELIGTIKRAVPAGVVVGSIADREGGWLEIPISVDGCELHLLHSAGRKWMFVGEHGINNHFPIMGRQELMREWIRHSFTITKFVRTRRGTIVGGPLSIR